MGRPSRWTLARSRDSPALSARASASRATRSARARPWRIGRCSASQSRASLGMGERVKAVLALPRSAASAAMSPLANDEVPEVSATVRARDVSGNPPITSPGSGREVTCLTGPPECRPPPREGRTECTASGHRCGVGSLQSASALGPQRSSSPASPPAAACTTARYRASASSRSQTEVSTYTPRASRVSAPRRAASTTALRCAGAEMPRSRMRPRSSARSSIWGGSQGSADQSGADRRTCESCPCRSPGEEARTRAL